MGSKLGYVPALDGLRALAIAMVFSGHLTGWPVGGAGGVTLFFVLSGFLITSLLLEEYTVSGRIGLRSFYARRARRLFPALAVMLLAYLVLDAVIYHANGLSRVAEYGLYGGNIYMAVTQHPFGTTGLDHLWSLAEEEQFYLVWPFALLLLMRCRRPARWLAIVFLALVCYRVALIHIGAKTERLAYAPDTRSEALVLGSLLALWRPLAREWLANASLMIAAFFVFAGNPAPIISKVPLVSTLPLFELAAAGLVVTALGSTSLARMLAWKPLVGLGKISYSLYLPVAPARLLGVRLPPRRPGSRGGVVARGCVRVLPFYRAAVQTSPGTGSPRSDRGYRSDVNNVKALVRRVVWINASSGAAPQRPTRRDRRAVSST